MLSAWVLIGAVVLFAAPAPWARAETTGPTACATRCTPCSLTWGRGGSYALRPSAAKTWRRARAFRNMSVADCELVEEARRSSRAAVSGSGAKF